MQEARKFSTPPEKWMLDRAKNHAKRTGIEFTITVSDVVIPGFCPVFPEIRLSAVGSKQCAMSPTIDRLKSNFGYIPGNVHVISRKANSLKSDGTAEQHERISVWMREHGAI